MEKTHNEKIIIDDIIEELTKKREELTKKREIAIYKMKQAMLKDEVSMYRLEQDSIDYVLFIIHECTGKLISKD